jgi:Glycosyl hydrolase family 26
VPSVSTGRLVVVLAFVLIAGLAAVFLLAPDNSQGSEVVSTLNAPTGGSTVPEADSSAGGQPVVPSSGKFYLGADADPSRVAQFDSEVGISQPAILGEYVGLNGQLSSVLDDVAGYRGTAPMVSWSLDFTQDLASGHQNAYLTQQADALIAYGKPVFLRPDWEMDGTWYPNWSLSKVTADRYIADWRYLVKFLRAAGVTNVAFVWCPNVGEPAGHSPSDWYPGDTYVDWIGADAYPRQGSGASDAFTETDGLNQFAVFAKQHGKPMMLAEWGVTSPDPDNGWLFDLVFQWAAAYPGTVKALVYFDYVGTKGDHLLVDHPKGAAEFERLVYSGNKVLTAVAAAQVARR